MATTTVLVPLDELAYQTGGTVASARATAERVGAKVRTDWAGRPSVSVEDAARAVEGYRRVMQESAELASAFDAAILRWERERQAAMTSAFEQAALKARERFLSTKPPAGYAEGGVLSTTGIAAAPGSFREAQAAAYAAGEQFEKRTPRPRNIEEFAKKWRRGRR